MISPALPKNPLASNCQIPYYSLFFLTSVSSNMNGIKKAALFLSGLDFAEVDQLLSRLDGESAKLVRREMHRHHNLSMEETQRLDEEFLHSAGWKPAGTIREYQFATPKPVTYAPPKRSTVKYGAEAFVPSVRSFDFMKNWPVNDVVSAVIDEHPQTIAVVLAHLPQKKMRAVLSVLPAELQGDIQRRLVDYEMPEDSVVQEIESALKMRYRNQRRTARHSATLESFEEMETLSDSELATLFHSVDLTTAMLALIGAERALITRIMRYFSPTEKHEMRKRTESLNSVDEEDIEHARQSLLEQYHATL